MRTRATLAILAALAMIGAVALWPSGGDGEADLDTVELAVDVEDDGAEVDDDAEAPAGGDGDLMVEDPDLGDGSGNYQLVELRSAPDGVDVRVYRNDIVGAECGAMQVRVGVSTDLAVGIVEILVPADREQTMIDSRVVGHPEGDRVVVVAGRVGSAITTVSAGMEAVDAFDQAAPVDGIVALALHLGDVADGPVTVNLTGADGTIETIELEAASGGLYPTSCPQELAPPPPEGVPPETVPPETVPPEPAAGPLEGNRAADRAEIIEVYDFWFNADVPVAAKASALDDPTGVIEAQIAVLQEFGSLIADAEAIVDSVEFVSETEASVAFHIDRAGSTAITAIGRAVLLDGSWRVTRDTVCPLIELGAVTC